ncbi:MAG: hypothetical protein V2I48_09515 [Xanthomonadales bacterium]|nr:hypothetical protein [Xanthomonadales bacterium]
MKFSIAILALMISISTVAQESNGPYVPCPGCENLQQAPFPETGLWHNPEEPGTGFMLEIQNGYVAGFRFAFDPNGNPDWWLISGPLELSEEPGVLWELNTEPIRYCEDGSQECLTQYPKLSVPYTPWRMEFLQRGYARVFWSSPMPPEPTYLTHYTFGSVSRAYFPDETPYLLPELTPDPDFSLWTFIFKEPSETAYAGWSSMVMAIGEAEVKENGEFAGKLFYRVMIPGSPPEALFPAGEIVCGPEAESEESICLLNPGEENEFRIPFGNFTDSRIFGEHADGGTVEAFRLNYD